MALVMILVVFWVGGTRIADFWHFANDVIAGWLVGAASAAVTFALLTGPFHINIVKIYDSIDKTVDNLIQSERQR